MQVDKTGLLRAVDGERDIRLSFVARPPLICLVSQEYVLTHMLRCDTTNIIKSMECTSLDEELPSPCKVPGDEVDRY